MATLTVDVGSDAGGGSASATITDNADALAFIDAWQDLADAQKGSAATRTEIAEFAANWALHQLRKETDRLRLEPGVQTTRDNHVPIEYD